MADRFTFSNGYDAKNAVLSSTLEEGQNTQTVIYEDRDSNVYIKASDLTAGSGDLLKRAIDNGYDAKVIMFASDLTEGNGEKTVSFNGYDALVVFDANSQDVEGEGTKTKLINGYDATALFGLTSNPPNFADVLQYINGDTFIENNLYYQEDVKNDLHLQIVESSVLQGDGLSVYSDIGDTGLGNGDFYYHLRGNIEKRSTGVVNVFCDGYAGFAGKTLALNTFTDTLNLNLDDDISPQTYQVLADGDWDDLDFLDIVIQRSGTGSNNITWNIENITKGTTITGSASNNGDYSSSSYTMLLLAVKLTPAEGSTVVNFNDSTLYCFECGTSSSNLVRQFNFGETSGSKIFDKIGTTGYDMNGTLTDIWQSEDNQRPHNNLDGFDLWQNDSDDSFVRVPFDSNGDSILTDGDTFTGYTWVSKNPGTLIGHNNSESKFKQPVSAELLAVSQNFAVNPWYSGSTPISFDYSQIEANYERAGYWFNDIFTNAPIKDKHVVYSSEQTNPNDLPSTLTFVNANELLTDSNGVTLQDSEGNDLYVYKEGA